MKGHRSQNKRLNSYFDLKALCNLIAHYPSDSSSFALTLAHSTPAMQPPCYPQDRRAWHLPRCCCFLCVGCWFPRSPLELTTSFFHHICAQMLREAFLAMLLNIPSSQHPSPPFLLCFSPYNLLASDMLYNLHVYLFPLL